MPTPLIVALIIGFACLTWACGCVLTARRLKPATRIVAALTFVPLVLFCMWGFAASMEPGHDHIIWRTGYGVVFLTCLTAIGWLVLAKRSNETANHD